MVLLIHTRLMIVELWCQYIFVVYFFYLNIYFFESLCYDVDMWTNDLQYVISQVCVVVAMIFLASTYFIKSKKMVLIFNIPVSVFFGIQYLLLGAYTGVIINAIGLIRCFWFYFNEKHGKKKDYISYAVINLLLLVLGIITFKTWVDIIAMLAGFLFTYSIWQSKIAVYKWFAVFVSICWIVHNSIYGSLFGIIAESILLLIEIIALFKFYFVENKRVE